MLKKLLAASALTAVSAIELTPANWDKETEGKTVFIKFLAPWCGHCKSMKPAWDKLMDAFKGNPTSLVADVDCTAAGQPLCEKNGVRGYPTIKYGEPGKLKDYQGGRDFDSLKSFADENLGPKCSPDNMNLCSKKVRAAYESHMGKEIKTLEQEIRDQRKIKEEAEKKLNEMRDVARHLRKLEREKKEAERKAAKAAKKKAEAEAKKKAEL